MQQSLIGRAIYCVEGVCLEITERGRAKKVSRFYLCDLSPAYTISEGRLWRVIKVGVVGFIISTSVTGRMLGTQSDIVFGLSVIPALFAIFFLQLTILSLPKRKFVSFNDSKGRYAFSILAIKDQERDLNQFLNDLTLLISQKTTTPELAPQKK